MQTLFGIVAAFGLTILIFVLWIVRAFRKLGADKSGLHVETLTVARCRVNRPDMGDDSSAKKPLAAVELNNAEIPISLFFSEDLDDKALLLGLVDALDEVPHLAGRIAVGDNPGEAYIACTNEGVSFKVQRSSNHRVEDFGRNASRLYEESTYRRTPFRDRLSIKEIMSGQEPLLRVVVTHLDGGGSVLGLCFSHVPVDATSMFHFLHLWASKTLGHTGGGDRTKGDAGLDTERARLLSMSGISETPKPKEEVEAAIASVLSAGGLGYTTAGHKVSQVTRTLKRFVTADDRQVTLFFSEKQLVRLKAMANAGCGAGRWVSSNDALCAHLWAVLMHVHSGAKKRTSSLWTASAMENFYLAVNIRPRVHPALAGNLFGNLSMAVYAKRPDGLQSAAQASGDGSEATGERSALTQLALAVRGAVNSLSGDMVQSSLQWLHHTWPVNAAKIPLSPRGYYQYDPCSDHDLMITSWRFDDVTLYDLDFGANNPIWVQPAGIYGAAILVDTPEKGAGCDAHLTIPSSFTIHEIQRLSEELLESYDT